MDKAHFASVCRVERIQVDADRCASREEAAPTGVPILLDEPMVVLGRPSEDPQDVPLQLLALLLRKWREEGPGLVVCLDDGRFPLGTDLLPAHEIPEKEPELEVEREEGGS